MKLGGKGSYFQKKTDVDRLHRKDKRLGKQFQTPQPFLHGIAKEFYTPEN